MKVIWVQVLGHIDAMSVRERVLLLASAVAFSALLADVFLVSPAKQVQQQLQQTLTTQSVELERLQKELDRISKPLDTIQPVGQALAQAEIRHQSLLSQIRSLSPASRPGQGLEQVLVQLLHRQEQLKLVSLTAIEPVGNTVSGASKPGSDIDRMPPGLRRRSLMLKVTGPYLELARYLKTLEEALPNLRWGSFHLSSDKPIPELSLQVSVLEAYP